MGELQGNHQGETVSLLKEGLDVFAQQLYYPVVQSLKPGKNGLDDIVYAFDKYDLPAELRTHGLSADKTEEFICAVILIQEQMYRGECDLYDALTKGLKSLTQYQYLSSINIIYLNIQQESSQVDGTQPFAENELPSLKDSDMSPLAQIKHDICQAILEVYQAILEVCQAADELLSDFVNGLAKLLGITPKFSESASVGFFAPRSARLAVELESIEELPPVALTML